MARYRGFGLKGFPGFDTVISVIAAMLLKHHAIAGDISMAIKILLAIHAESGKDEEVRLALRNMREVTFASTTYGGPYDVMAIVEVKNLEKYRSFALDFVSKIADIDDYVSFIAIGLPNS